MIGHQAAVASGVATGFGVMAHSLLTATKGFLKWGIVGGCHDLTVGAVKELFAKEKDLTTIDKYGRPTINHHVPRTWDENLEGASGKVAKGILKIGTTAMIFTGTGCGALKYGMNVVDPGFKINNPFCKVSQTAVETLYQGATEYALPAVLGAAKFAGTNIPRVLSFAWNHPKGTVLAIPTLAFGGTAVWRTKVAADHVTKAWSSNSIVEKTKGYGAGFLNLGLAAAAGAAAVTLNVWAATISSPIDFSSGNGTAGSTSLKV